MKKDLWLGTRENKPVLLMSVLNLIHLLSRTGSHWRQKWVQYQLCQSFQ